MAYLYLRCVFFGVDSISKSIVIRVGRRSRSCRLRIKSDANVERFQRNEVNDERSRKPSLWTRKNRWERVKNDVNEDTKTRLKSSDTVRFNAFTSISPTRFPDNWTFTDRKGKSSNKVRLELYKNPWFYL